MAQHFDLSALETLIDRALGAGTHQALDLHAKLVAQAFGHGKHLGAVRVAHHLHIAFAVAQVHKDHATMVAPAVDPTAQADGLPQQGFGHQTAIMGSHCHCEFPGKRDGLGARGARQEFGGVEDWVSAGLGNTTPMETMYLSASSTLMRSSMQSARGSITI